ncbi:hypothetical protein [Lysobacter sp. FW306-1B-D06B]|uniref:hypothetical protein n=1 Tax=Lysobacter sp. FW306-1B-D06B TaxID=3140250 RepID=UPI0031404006
MERERASHAEDLQKLRVRLEGQANTELEHLKSELGITSAKRMRDAQDKMAIYRLVVDIVADILSDFDLSQDNTLPDARERFDRFNRGRMKAYGYMAMLAPQKVMDAFDEVIDHLLEIAQGTRNYHWPEVRELAIALVDEIRKDVGLDQDAIRYNGRL